MGMIFNIQTKCITWISLYKQYYTILKLLFYKLQSKYCLQLHRYPLLTHKSWMPSFPRSTLVNEHKIAVEDHLPPNKKQTLEDKLALGSLSVHFLGNSALTESASGAITYPGRNSIAKSREIDSGIGWGLASGVEVEIELWGSEGGEVEGVPLNCVVQLRASLLSLGYPFTSANRTQFGSLLRLPAGPLANTP